MKHVLFITYYFPPSGGSGVQRPLKFVKYLPEFDWKVTVLTVSPEKAAYPDIDPELAADIPEGTIVVGTDAWDPYSVYARLTGKKKENAVGVGFLGADHASWKEKVSRWIRANLFLPDARVGWVKHAKREGLTLLESESFDAVFSTGPPHSTHLIASFLAGHGTLPWVADLRDAWPDMAYADMLPTTQMARRRDISLRNETLQRATVCIAVTTALRNTMSNAIGRPVEVIRNGFDPADFKDLAPRSHSMFTLVHTGNMAPARNPEPLWEALEQESNAGNWSKLGLVCIGNVDPGILANAAERGLGDRVELVEYVPHSEALSFTAGASLLLLPINRVNDAAGIVTGKIYEYIASGRPIIGLGDPSGEAAEILRETGAGQLFDYEDVAGVRQFINKHYEAWLAGSPLNGAEPARAAAYSRRSQTEQLATLLNRITAS